MSESDINEADFAAVPSPLYFDLLDLHLLGLARLPTKKMGEGGVWNRAAVRQKLE